MNFLQFMERFPDPSRRTIFAISGDQAGLREIVQRKIKDRYHPHRVDVRRLSTTDAYQVLAACRETPVFGRLLVEAEDFEKWRERDALATWMKSGPDDVVLTALSQAKSPRTDNEFAQAAISSGWWVVCRRPPFEELTEFTAKHFNIPDPIAEVVVAEAGGDLIWIQHTLAQLAVSLGGRKPSAADIQAAFGGRTSAVFRAASDTIEGNVQDISRYLDSSALPALLSLARRRATETIRVRALVKRGARVDEISSDCNIPIFLVPSRIDQAKRCSVERAANILAAVHEVESLRTRDRAHDEALLAYFLSRVR